MMPKIVQGHEIWVEYEYKHIHTGEGVKCKLLYGHNMKVDGVVDIKKMKVVFIDPQNEKHDLVVNIEDGYLIVPFVPKHEGYHTIVAEYDGGIFTVTKDGWQKGPKCDYENVKSSGYYYQYAKTIIPVGHEYEKYDIITGHELEIVPLNFRRYHTGEDITLQVLYDGRMLPDAVINATYGGREDDPIEIKTNLEGKATIQLEKEGNWLFKVRHSDPNKSVEDQYDEKVTTTVFTLMGVTSR